MKIDIDQHTKAELIDINRRIVERLRFLKQRWAHVSMLKLSVDTRVCFDTDDFGKIGGMLIRYRAVPWRNSASNKDGLPA
jgi:hypothetical protein